jgi:hypothetical protein|nr:MAG TPA: hypothetical protein [Bacteriophage sp.]
MRVISQTGKTDVPYENFVFSILNSSGGNYVIVAVKNVAEPPEVFLNSLIATYSTEAKAVKAMEMLRKAYENNAFYHCVAGSKRFEEVQRILSEEQFRKATTEYFQFPQGDEIEV